MELRIDHCVSDFIILQLLERFLGDYSYRKNKATFLIYLRSQIERFGSDEESQIQETKKLSERTLAVAEKWFKITL